VVGAVNPVYNPYLKHTERLKALEAARNVRIARPPPLLNPLECQVNLDTLEIKPDLTHPPRPSGLFTSHFDEQRFLAFKAKESKRLYYSTEEFKQAKSDRKAPPQRAENNRLVYTRKSPTKNKGVNLRECVARVHYRQWSDEYRVNVDSTTRLNAPPPSQSGERTTDKLTDRAARKIIDSGAYVATKENGFSTFLTLTFDSEARARIASDETTIGEEISRFFDGLQKKYVRGWTWKPTEAEKSADMFTPDKVKFDGKRQKLNYIWVAENPDTIDTKTNGIGQTVEYVSGTNPHVHVLLDWAVEYEYFRGWAAQIESLWGQGMANLQKIRNSKSATGYLLKALGYMTKGNHKIDKNTGELTSGQGVIRGNRYGISSEARAPDWVCISEFQAAHMGQIVLEIGQKIEAKQAAIKTELKALDKRQQNHKKQLAKAKNLPVNLAGVRRSRIAAIENMLNQDKKRAESLKAARTKNPYGGKYRVTFRGIEQLDRFFEYAIYQRNWSAKVFEATEQYLFRPLCKAATLVKQSVSEKAASVENYWAAVVNDKYQLQIGEYASE
jgi:hypothetical protein